MGQQEKVRTHIAHTSQVLPSHLSHFCRFCHFYHLSHFRHFREETKRLKQLAMDKKRKIQTLEKLRKKSLNEEASKVCVCVCVYVCVCARVCAMWALVGGGTDGGLLAMVKLDQILHVCTRLAGWQLKEIYAGLGYFYFGQTILVPLVSERSNTTPHAAINTQLAKQLAKLSFSISFAPKRFSSEPVLSRANN